MADSPLRAELFVTRPNGNMVPLVAIDELPHRIVIEGVPRIMSAFDIAGMTCVGCFGFRHRQHSLDQKYKPTDRNKDTGVGEFLKAKFFIARDNGGMIPVVAMDEMPEHFALEDVPRNLSVFDITGMTCIGLHDARDKLHIINDVNEVPFAIQSDRGSPTPPAERGRIVLDTPRNTPPTSTPTSFRSPSAVPSTLSLNPSTTNGALKPGVKEFCSYWLRHGECDYAQQGCLYRHEMPLDHETLSSLGLRDIPRWYREKHGLGSFLAAGGSGAAFGGSGLKSTVAIGMTQEITRPPMVQNARTRATQDTRQFFDRRRPRNQTRPSVDRSNSNRNPGQKRERASSISSAIAFLKSRNQPPGDKADSDEMPPNPQSNKAVRAQAVHEKLSENPSITSDMPRSKANIDTSKKSGSASADEADISCVSSDNLTDTSTTPTRNQSPSLEEITTGRTRGLSQASLLSDIEADVHRKDAARKAKEDEAYRLSCEAYAAKTEVEAAVETAKPAPGKITGGKDVKSSSGSDRRGSNGGRRGRGHYRGGNRSRQAVAKGAGSV